MKIEKRGLEELITDERRRQSSLALDRLWEEPWVKASINKSDRKRLAAVQETAGRFRRNSDIIVVAAAGTLAKLIRAAVSALPREEDGARLIVFGDSLSPAEYADVLTMLQEKDFSLIAAASGEEAVSQRGAYACLKQLLIAKYGSEAAASRIAAVAGRESRFLSMEATDNDYPLISYPEGVPAAYGANGEGLLLPLAAAGAETEPYLDGFYDMLASPFWDLDGADYGIARAAHREQSGGGEELFVWQRQLEAFGLWQTYAAERVPARLFRLPDERPLSNPLCFGTTLLIEEDEEDIMMPYFEGCNQDGSLNLLLRESAERYFYETADGPGIKLSVEQMDAYALGQLFAFMQLSNGITEQLLRA